MIDETEIAWEPRGACRTSDPDLFFPGLGEPTAPAKAICNGCDVRLECLDYALRNHEHWGVWGGKSERQRRALRRKWRPTMTLGELARPGRKPRAA